MEIQLLTLCAMISFLLGFIVSTLNNKKSKYLNTTFDMETYDVEKAHLSPLEFKVDKVEGCYTKNRYKHIAKYTVHICYPTKKHKCNYETFYFFADKGKYNVGDTLTLK